MAEPPASSRQALVEGVQRRVRLVSISANLAGGLVVFLFLAFVLPAPRHFRHAWWLVGLNGGLLLLSAGIGMPLASRLLARVWRARLAWVAEGRRPSASERELALRFVLVEHVIIARWWALGALLFGVLNVFFSPLLAINVAVTIALGGLVTLALGYLLCERELRPITALVLSSGLPERPQLPGVAARTLLSWTLGTGVVLLGLVLIGLGALVLHGYYSERDLSIVVLVLALTGSVVGLLIMLGLARSLSEPIDDLRAAVARVGRGELDHDVTVNDGSEVGLLQAGFHQMLSGLRERERIRDLFGRQVGEDVVRHALEHGVELGGEARRAAVLFVDLAGSTRLAAERDPAEVVGLLNAFFAIVVEVVAAHDGWVNKFEGDAALCAFGVPLADEACAGKALAAGRELWRRLRAEIPELSAGIGISAGRVVAGNVGAARRFEYTVIGDAVNEAARLSELAKRDGGVVASGAALDAAGDQESGRWRRRSEEVTLRGRLAPTELAVPAGGE